MRESLFPVLLLLITGICSVSADDTELYVNSALAGSAQPNVVIIYDTSSSMCANTILNANNMLRCGLPDPDDMISRDVISRGAIIRFINKLNHGNVSVLSFNPGGRPDTGTAGGRVRFASEDISTARSSLISEFTSNFKAEVGIDTPLVGTIYEALLYLAGEPPKYGDGSYHSSVASSISGGQYISPIRDQCQATFIIVFTDGEGHDNFAKERPDYINFLSRSTQVPPPPPELDLSDCDSGFFGVTPSCLDEFGWYAHNHDLNSSIPGDQKATVYAVGAFIHSDNSPVLTLERFARLGGGESFSVFDELSLDNALETIKTKTSIVQQVTLTQTAPAIPFSAFNFLEHSEEVYYALFQPDAGPGWRGNLKRYRLGTDNQIYDADGQLAIDPATGFFSNAARSFWSSAADGSTVTSGGMAEHLDKNRSVFTNVNRDSRVSLGGLVNQLHENNRLITETMLGAANTAEAETILKWARGLDVDDENSNGSTTDDRTSIGDPLHTKPQAITYYKDDSSGVSVVDRTLYFTTNDGFLHGVDTSDGSTEFSFIPADLLGNLKIYRDGSAPGGSTKIYGMDGPMTSWIYDKNGDGDLLQSDNGFAADADDGEHAYLYLTMRRGGNNIYALDVTNRTNPELKWVIRGDTNNDHHRDLSGDFRHLGQTWSRVKPAIVKWNGKDQAVLFFGGGYDVDIDGHPEIPDRASNIGNAVYMVDAERGSLLWTAGQDSGIDLHVNKMVFSIPAELSLADYDADGITDYFFAVDTGGQIFRFDINDANTSAGDFADGGRIARLAGVNNPLDARRFFEAPVVAFNKDYDAINIAVGSGYRPSPLSTATRDRFYVIRDVHVDRAPTSYNYASGSYIKTEDLYDATDNLIQDGTVSEQTAARAALDSKHGWYINLEGSGEKVLNKASIYNGVLSFVTSTPNPDPNLPNSCTPARSMTNYLYAVNIENGGALINFTGNTATLGKAHRRVTLSQTGVAPEPSILTRSNQRAEFCVGTECFQGALQDIQGLPTIFRGGWRENR